jgi:hypothetical protein
MAPVSVNVARCGRMCCCPEGAWTEHDEMLGLQADLLSSWRAPQPDTELREQP